jgi:hypothetical protein
MIKIDFRIHPTQTTVKMISNNSGGGFCDQCNGYQDQTEEPITTSAKDISASGTVGKVCETQRERKCMRTVEQNL